MPVPTSTPTPYTVDVYNASQLPPPSLLAALENCPHRANVLLPQLYKMVKKALRGKPPLPGQHWLVLRRDSIIQLVLAVTESEMGKYPIFIIPIVQGPQLSSTPYRGVDGPVAQYYKPRLVPLITKLVELVPTTRAYSVFAPDDIAYTFANLWTAKTGIEVLSEPYYAAKLTYCTKRTFRPRAVTVNPEYGYEMRPAKESDLEGVAALCFGFAKESEPFTLTMEQARQEASILIRHQQVWIHFVRPSSASSSSSASDSDEDSGQNIASLVAMTRNLNNVATITKVYTNPRWRRRGCAERLVRRVCKEMLRQKEALVLYISHTNPAAANVYHRVGFVGLSADAEQVEGVESWTELGFDTNKVTLGHW